MSKDNPLKPSGGFLRSVVFLIVALAVGGGGYFLYTNIVTYTAPSDEISCEKQGNCPVPFFANVHVELCGTQMGYTKETITKSVTIPANGQKFREFFTLLGTAFDGQCIGDTCNGDSCRGKPGEFKMWVNDREITVSDEYQIAPEDEIVLSFQERTNTTKPNVSTAYRGPYYVFAPKRLVTAPIANEKRYPLTAKDGAVTWSGADALANQQGTITLKSGYLQATTTDWAPVSGVLQLDMQSLVHTVPTEDQGKEATVFLQSGDMFHTGSYADMSLELVQFDPMAEAGKWTATANVTIKGVTRVLRFPVTVTAVSDAAVDLEMIMDMRLEKWGITFVRGQGTQGNRMQLQYKVRITK